MNVNYEDKSQEQEYDPTLWNSQDANEVKACIASKQDAEAGKGLSTNDYTTTDKNKLASLTVESTSTIKTKLGEVTSLTDGYLTAENFNVFSGKADKVNGIVPIAQLPAVYFSGMSGTGTQADPFVVSSSGGQASAEQYLKSLPGYDVNKILYSDLTWGEVPSGNQTKLVAPTLTIGTPAVDSIAFSWVSVFGATKYELQRDTTIQFLTPITVYNSSGLQQVDSGLSANTTYQYRFRISGAGYAASDWVLYTRSTPATGNTTPSAPTLPVTNDTADTFGFTLVSGFALAGNYQYTLDGGTTVVDVTTNPISVGNVAKAIGQVGVRVKAGTDRNASAWLFNTVAFTIATITPSAPTLPITNDTADTFDWTFTAGITALADYQITLDGGTTYSDVVAKPFYVGDVALAVGKVGVRVKAATGRNVSSTLYNSVAFNQKPEILTPVELWHGLQHATALNSNSFSFTTTSGEYGQAFSNYKLVDGTEGIIQMDVITPEPYSANLSLATEKDNNGNSGAGGCHMWSAENGKMLARINGAYINGNTQGNTVGINTKMRIRVTLANVFFEVSTNSGTTFSTMITGARPAGDLYLKLSADVNVENIKAENVVMKGLVEWS